MGSEVYGKKSIMTAQEKKTEHAVFQQDVCKEKLKSVNGGGCPNGVIVGQICENNANLGCPIDIPHPGIPIGRSSSEN